MNCAKANRPDVCAPEPSRGWALFLDIDGTLIDIAPTPDAVNVPHTLVPTLRAASGWLDGALAIVSGRTLTVIDKLMAPLRLPSAGEHGATIRLPDGTIRNAAERCAVPDAWKKCVRNTAKNWDGVVVEYKPYSIAAHFRLNPARERDVRMLFQSIVAENTQDFEVLAASQAFEIRHRALTKGAAVRELMKHEPFLGRVPVFVGDDVTDKDGFYAAKEAGGLGLDVSEVFGGRPSNVRRWLGQFLPAATR